MQIKPFNYNRFSACFISFIARILKVILQFDTLVKEEHKNPRVTQERKETDYCKVNHFLASYDSKEAVQDWLHDTNQYFLWTDPWSVQRKYFLSLPEVT